MAVAIAMEEAEQEAREGVLTEAQVRKHIGKAYEIATGGKLHFHTIESWLNWWLENKAKAKREGTTQRYRGTIISFLDGLKTKDRAGRVTKDRGKLDIRHLDTKDAERFRTALVKSGKANKTINVDLKTVSSAFNLAKRQGLMDHNPFQALDHLPVAESVKKAFTSNQTRSIFRHAEGEWFGVCMIGFYTGMRISDITQLRWGEVELNSDPPLIRFKERKKQDRHRREIVVPNHPILLEHFLGLEKGRKDDYLFPELQPKGTGGNKGLSQSFKRILRDAGIVKELYKTREKGSVKRNVSPFSFHSFRHTFKTMLANKGVPEDVRDVLTGHAKPSVAQAYVHRDVQVLADAIANLPALKVA